MQGFKTVEKSGQALLFWVVALGAKTLKADI